MEKPSQGEIRQFLLEIHEGLICILYMHAGHMHVEMSSASLTSSCADKG